MLNGLVFDASEHKLKMIDVDFNAKALDWRSRLINTSGQICLETFTELDMVLANVGCVINFQDKSSI